MERKFLKVQDGAIYSPATIYLAYLLRRLHVTSKSDVIKWLTTKVEDKCFSKAEAIRIWKALHEVTFYHEGSAMTGFAGNKLSFPRNWYTNNSNSFENYAKDIMNLGNVIKHYGRKPGQTSPAIVASTAKMREIKAAKRLNVKQEDSTSVKYDISGKLDLSNLSEDNLYELISQCETEIKRREEIRAKQVRIQKVLETVGMSKDELIELLGVC